MRFFNLLRSKTVAPEPERKPSKPQVLDIPDGIRRVQLAIHNVCGTIRGTNGAYAVVTMFNPALPEWGWRELSPRFFDFQSVEDKLFRANSFIRSVLLYGNDVIAAKRIVFLECLQRHCAKEHIEWFFQYVVGMFRYFSTCFVKDDSRIEICINHQLEDMGDEFFDMAYGVTKELGLKPVNDSFNMTCLERLFPNDDEIASRGYNNGRFLHVGSDIKGLMQVHWVIDLNDIKFKGEE